MIASRSLIISALMCCGGPLIAATPVASIFSTEPIEVSGVVIPALQRVLVALDDEVLTRNNAAVMRFQDGSEIALQPNSRVRLEKSNGTVGAHIVSGSATYKIAPQSSLKLIDSMGAVVNSMTAAASSVKLAQGAVAYRASAAPGAGIVLPANAISYGQFTPGTRDAVGIPNTGPRILTPSGVQIEVQIVNGQTVITNVLIPLTNPTTGQIQYLQVDTFNGGTIALGDVNGPTSVSITPVGQTTPLTPAQAQQTLQTGTNTSLTASITSGQLPINTPAPTPQTVNTGTFSASAP